MADYLKVDGRRWPAHDGEVKRLFGLRQEAKWPAAGMPAREVQGVTCWVEPVVPGKFRIRARCACPNCGKTLATGRLAQHWREVHKVRDDLHQDND